MKKRPWIVSFLMQEDGETKCKKIRISDTSIFWAEVKAHAIIQKNASGKFFIHEIGLGDDDMVCDEVIEDDPIGWPEDDLDESEW